jgi:hypothetical protein
MELSTKIRKVPPALIAAGALILPSAAIAAPVDRTSDHVALRAYQRYFSWLVSQAPAWRRDGDAFVASISGSCPNVLAAVNLLPVSSVNKGAVTSFGEEIGADLGAVANVSSRVPLGNMAKTLSGLRWSSHQTSEQIKRFLAATRKLVRLAPSDVCADARALAASNAQVTPPGTLRFLATVGRVSSAARAGGSAFETILARFQTAADRPVIDGINRLKHRLTSALRAFATAEVGKVLSALGLSA